MIQIGKQVGDFLVKAEIRKGGMGTLYYALDTLLNREVALKVLHPHEALSKEELKKFRTEAMTQAQMNHPNIITLYCFSRIDDFDIIAMEYIKGTSMQEILATKSHFPLETAVHQLKQILRGLNYAHKRHIIHGDIKPGNIMITDENAIKLSDFGIARISGYPHIGSNGFPMGTAVYASPEQILGQALDQRSDIYSLGITFYEMVTGEFPFPVKSDSSIEIEQAHLKLKPVKPSIFNPKIIPEIDEFILKAIQKKPEMRFQSVIEMLETLDHLSISKKGGDYEN
jgi:serine/threonine-protein kinase